ncbi:BSD domain-containing protein 1-B-like isoform X1 [Macrobrachium rosenbergii]|uniref:BSD domain-containing protein 1-B-like isoform X1 n=1 Tax=Macrobrachium rosenbergii TaxID=79674 RepID=UPI0034D3A08B
MAEGCYQDSTIALFYGGRGDGSWWGWFQSARDKVVSQSSEVLEFVKKDIDEFTKVVTEEASSVVSSTASTLKEKLRLDDDESTANNMKKSVSGFLNHVAEVFTTPPDDADQEAIVIRNQQPIILNRLQAAIYAISQDAATFLTDPEGEEKEYEEWLGTFDLESHQTELSDLLVNNQPLRHNYTALVPAQVSHVVFWHRYFYKVKELEKADARRQELKQRVEKKSADPELVWDEDEEFGGDVEITEEMQAQLLEDYQRECEELGRSSSDNDDKKLDSVDKDETSSKDSEVKDSSNEESSSGPEKLLEVLNVDLNKTSEVASKPSPSSTESNEDEWEKVDATEAAASQSSTSTSTDKPKTEKADGKGEDWESWD